MKDEVKEAENKEGAMKKTKTQTTLSKERHK